LAEFNAKRRALVKKYFDLLDTPEIQSLGLGLPPRDFTQSNWHMFQVVLPEDRLKVKRAEIMAQMHAAGIGTGVHYPAIHLFAVYRRLGWKEGDFPQAEYTCRNILTLPLFPAMNDADVSRVVETLARIVRANLK
jgi:dTDP-4-amino-4,6-dideoxygalactose transaminase